MTSLKSRKAAAMSKDGNGQPYLTPEFIRACCVEQGLYEQPHLNEKLYLHFKGFKKIQGLKEYINLKALWLESNGIEEIMGLDKMVELRMLYLHQNSISAIKNLTTLEQLVTLNLSHNKLRKVEGLECCLKLKTLDLSHNFIYDIADCEQVIELPELSNLDLRDNQIDTHNDIVPFFERMPQITCLYLANNPCVRLISNYRR